MGGAARGGLANARADLFKDRPWIFTPHSESSGEAIHKLSQFAIALGARPRTMTPAEHDRLLAVVSHLPQLTASALMSVVGEGAQSGGLALAGRGLVDTTRLAASPADIWRDICATNAQEIGHALDILIGRLAELRDGLEDGACVDAIFEQAARWREELMRGR
jgi:prephenate dehydrogenase